MATRSGRGLVTLGLLGLIGMVGGCRSVRPPYLANPGPIRQQQLSAALHDPYADVDAGPEVLGSRPRDFMRPAAEPVRSRWLRDSFWCGF